MEAQEAVLLESIARPEVPDDIQAQLTTYQLRVKERVEDLRRIDADIVEVLDHSLDIEKRVHERMGKEPLCMLCPRLDKVALYPPTSNHTCRMEFRCGHSVHTQCFLHFSYHADVLPNSLTCPHCTTNLMEDSAISFFRQLNRRTHIQVVELWNNDPVFRDTFRALCKERTIVIKAYTESRKDTRPIVREFKQIIDIPVKTLGVHKKEFSAKIKELTSRRRFLALGNRYMKRLSTFTKKYGIWSDDLGPLHGVQGVPRFPRRMRLPYRYNCSVDRLLRIKRM